MTYQTEFPDFPADAMPAIPAGFTDRSWRNEPCPCFIHEATGVVLWIDYPEPASREVPELPRFRAQACMDRHAEAGWQLGGSEVDLCESEEWEAIASRLPAWIALTAEVS